jgi:hypothetical protein
MVRKKEILAANVVPIVGDGAIANPDVGDGRLVPVLIVDCSKRPDLLDLIRAHEHLPPGDVKVTWGGRLGWGGRILERHKVVLILEFERPSRLDAVLEFDIERQGGLVDLIVHAHALYLQPSESGTRVIEGLQKPKISVEIPDTNFLPIWNDLYGAALKRVFRKKGLSSKEAELAKSEHIKRMRELSSIRIPTED